MKSGFMAIIGGPKGGAKDREGYGDDEEEGGPSINDMARKRAGKALLRAIEGNDPGAVADAFEQLADACAGGEDEEE